MDVNVIENLESKNIEYKREGNEALIICPYCHKQKLSINVQTGVYKCWHCKALEPSSPYIQGHISQLQKEWGDIASISDLKTVSTITREKEDEIDFTQKAQDQHDVIFKHKNAVKYLMKRGFSEDDINNFKLGYKTDKNEEWISIPIYEGNVVKLIKYRKITDNTDAKKYDREKGGKSILYNQDKIDLFDTIIITEGEIDCLTLLSRGYENVVGLTVGASTLKPEWYDLLNKKEKIILILDSDDVGQASAKNIWATRLGVHRCYNVVLPKNLDINDYFLRYTKESFDELIKSAIQFKVDGVVSLEESLYMMYDWSLDEENTRIFQLPWENVNRLIGGGLQRKRLTIVGGTPGTGKTSWALQVCYHLAKEYNIPSLFWCLEMPEIALATKIIQVHNDLMIEDISFGDALIYMMELKDIPIYFGYSSNMKAKTFYNTMVEVRNRYGVEFGVFDNLQRMVRTGEESDIGSASGVFKDITMDLNIPFIVISQPRKLSSSESVPTNDDLKGSSAIPADADEIIWLYRKTVKDARGNSAMEPETHVIVSKSRFSSGGKTFLKFFGEKSKFIKED